MHGKCIQIIEIKRKIGKKENSIKLIEIKRSVSIMHLKSLKSYIILFINFFSLLIVDVYFRWLLTSGECLETLDLNAFPVNKFSVF